MDGVTQPDDAPEPSRTTQARALLGGATAGWSLLLLVYAISALVSAEELNLLVAGVALLVPASILQGVTGVAIMLSRAWTRRVTVVVAVMQVAGFGVGVAHAAPDDAIFTAIVGLVFAGPALLAAIALRVPPLRGHTAPAARRAPWMVARDLIGASNMVAGLVMMLMIAGFTASSAESVFVSAMVAVPVFLQIVGGAQLVREKTWAYSLLQIAATIQLLLALVVIVTSPEAAPLALAAVPAVGSAICLLHPAFDLPRSDGLLRKLGSLSFAGAVGLCCFAVLASEARDAKRAWDAERHAEQCEESGRPEACGRLALNKIRQAQSYDEMREGRQQLDELCRAGNRKSCRFAGYVRTNTYSDFMPEAARQVKQEVGERALDRCEAEDADACAVALRFAADKSDELVERTKKLCRAKPGVACHAWAQHDPADEEASTLACTAGFAAHCSRPDAEPSERCLDGDLQACAALVRADDGADFDVYRELAALTHAYRDPGLFGAEFVGTDYVARCDGGSMAACVAAGRQLLGPLHGFEPPALPAVDALDATLGRACDGGAALGCLVYGTWLLDRPLGEERDVERANALLTKGCELGSSDACRMRSFDAEIVAGDDSAQLAALREGCAHTNSQAACDPFYSAFAGEIGLAPWSVSDGFGLPFFRKACVDGDLTACTHVAWLYSSRHDYADAIPSFRYAGMDAASRACRAHDEGGCGVALSVVETWWPEQLEDTRSKICGQIEAAGCD